MGFVCEYIARGNSKAFNSLLLRSLAQAGNLVVYPFSNSDTRVIIDDISSNVDMICRLLWDVVRVDQSVTSCHVCQGLLSELSSDTVALMFSLV